MEDEKGFTTFVAQHGQQKVVFGVNSIQKLKEELTELGSKRVAIITTPNRQNEVVKLVKDNAGSSFEYFVVANARQHVPVATVKEAVASLEGKNVDTALALGGGSTVGLAKALCLHIPGLKHVSIPTTYSGSEMTHVYGLTEDGVKKTAKDEAVRARLVIYDSVLSRGLPEKISIESALNALAHAVEATYAENTSPAAVLSAEEGVRALNKGLNAIQSSDKDRVLAARDQLLYGAYHCGLSLTSAQMGIHHRMAHTLGGLGDLPHAETHAILLPHSLYYNRDHCPRAVERIGKALGCKPDIHPAHHIFDLMKKLGLKTSLRTIDMKHEDIGRAVELAIRTPCPNPRPVEKDWVADYVMDAWLGRCPDHKITRDKTIVAGAKGLHNGLATAIGGCPMERAEIIVVCCHGRGAQAEGIIHQFQDCLGGQHSHWMTRIAVVAPMAAQSSWWPQSFLAETGNEAHIESAMSVLDATFDYISKKFVPENIILYGFSQGACLAQEYLARHGPRAKTLLCLSGGLVGQSIGPHNSDLTGVRAFIMCSDKDAHVPLERIHDSVSSLKRLGAECSSLIFPGETHAVFNAERSIVTDAVYKALNMSRDPYEYHWGFNSHIESEALPGVVPKHGNAPKHVAYKGYAEQLTGTSFVAKRSESGVCWYYRINPSTGGHGEFKDYKGNDKFRGTFEEGVLTPEPIRWNAFPIPPAKTKVDFVDGLITLAGGGDPLSRNGFAIHVYACNADMENKSFYNSDGDLLIVPEEGALDIQTENGFLRVNPTECFVLPRGIKMTVRIIGDGARGFVSEVYNHHYRLPERGLIGVDHLAEDRHFQIPKAAFEDKICKGHQMVTKFGGKLFVANKDHSPYDVMGWAGNYAPYKYDMMKFSPVMQGKYDHIDPSAHTVLTCPLDNLGNNVVDFVAFVGRWDASEYAFRPPFHHRNHATEFNGIVTIDKPYAGYEKGGSFLTPFMSAHGVSAQSCNGFHESPDEIAKTPFRLSDESLWIMFETTLQLKVMPWAKDAKNKDKAYRQLSTDTPRRIDNFTYNK